MIARAVSGGLPAELSPLATTVCLAAASIVGIEGVVALFAMFGLSPLALVLAIAGVATLAAAGFRRRPRRDENANRD